MAMSNQRGSFNLWVAEYKPIEFDDIRFIHTDICTKPAIRRAGCFVEKYLKFDNPTEIGYPREHVAELYCINSGKEVFLGYIATRKPGPPGEHGGRDEYFDIYSESGRSFFKTTYLCRCRNARCLSCSC